MVLKGNVGFQRCGEGAHAMLVPSLAGWCVLMERSWTTGSSQALHFPRGVLAGMPLRLSLVWFFFPAYQLIPNLNCCLIIVFAQAWENFVTVEPHGPVLETHGFWWSLA